MTRRNLFFISITLLIASTWLSLTVGKIEGPPAHPESVVRNILYAHVPSSIAALLCFTVLLIASIGYLATSRQRFDDVAAACGEVGMIFAAVLNLSGSIFSRAEWNTWWTPSPRLISAAILWFLYIVYLILRSSIAGSRQKRARICAVFGILAFIDIPLVIISARFMPDIHKPNFSFTSGWQSFAFMTAMVTTIFLAGLLVWLRTDIIVAKNELEKELSY